MYHVCHIPTFRTTTNALIVCIPNIHITIKLAKLDIRKSNNLLYTISPTKAFKKHYCVMAQDTSPYGAIILLIFTRPLHPKRTSQEFPSSLLTHSLLRMDSQQNSNEHNIKRKIFTQVSTYILFCATGFKHRLFKQHCYCFPGLSKQMVDLFKKWKRKFLTFM